MQPVEHTVGIYQDNACNRAKKRTPVSQRGKKNFRQVWGMKERTPKKAGGKIFFLIAGTVGSYLLFLFFFIYLFFFL